jgi:hypothetical protein
MAPPVTGMWANAYANANQYVGALKWGTGNNPVHEVYGEGPPLSVTNRVPGPSTPTEAIGDVDPTLEATYDWGYCPEDIATLEPYYGFPPALGTETDDYRASVTNQGGQPSWDETSTDPEVVQYRNTQDLDPRLWNGHAVRSFPTETVTEGWRNKTSGSVEAAQTSDQSQYERQTSMQQVDPEAGRNNQQAVARDTDDPRYSIRTRLTGQKIKPWSDSANRRADMFPYQQDTLVRPFTYRTAGTGYPEQMEVNEMYVSAPVQRDPAADPFLGPNETDVAQDGYGYVAEDMVY